MATFPTLALYWSPTTGPLAAPSWSAFPTITVGGVARSRLRAGDGITIMRGRADELDSFEAGTMTLVLDNRDRALDPMNTSATYLSSLKPRTPIQLRATWNSVEYTLFTGLVDGWPQAQDVSQRDQTVTVTATDQFVVLAERGFRPGSPWILDETDGNASSLDASNRLNDPRPRLPTQPSGERVRYLLELAGWPADLMDVDTGDTVVVKDQPDPDNNKFLDYVDRVARTELGRFFVKADGKVAFWARHHFTSQTSAATFTDAAGSNYRYAGLELNPLDMDLVRNEVVRGNANGDDDDVAMKRDSASIAAYGLSADEQTDLLYADRWEAPYACQWILDRYGDPVARAKSLLVRPQRAASTLFPLVLGWEIGQQFSVRSQPMRTGTATTMVVNVEQITHEIGAGEWSTSYTVSLADTAAYFTLDTTTVNVLDSTNLLGY